ncbi:unnamed protein product [Leptidea sinapis]|uniref:C2H2-type domain-containing protein n=1 Tax=Leptidea sinapis TaxID=189913 RepID=A0A5E4PVV0_9NEOP|nr:unnamed protein product [Leptidea sinapis]
MNQDHHSISGGSGQTSTNSEGQRVQSGQQQQQAPTTSATDLRVNSAVNVALSSVAKYWVFTNLFPGPIPQVSLYGLPASTRIENGKPVQDLGQSHASLLNGDPNIILGHHSAQPQVTVSAAGGQQIPISQLITTQSGQGHEMSSQQNSSSSQVTVNSQSAHQQPSNRLEFGHHTQNHLLQQQLLAATRPEHSNQQIQLTVSEDGIVTVVEPGSSKLMEKDDLHDSIKMPSDHTLTVHQLQQIVGHHQVIDSVVRIEQATGEPANILVTQNPDGTTSIETSAADSLIVKDEKNVKIESAQYAAASDIKEIKGIDLKSVGAMGMEGAVVKISGGGTDNDMHAMYKVNVEDLSQLLAYHEVFGKLNTDSQQTQQAQTPPQQPQAKPVMYQVDVEASTSASATLPDTESSSGPHPCAIMVKINLTPVKFAARHSPIRRNCLNMENVTLTPHRCDICKKSFTRKEHFLNHVMWHTGETPHQCQICGKKYTRKEHLVNHMRSHTNDTPFRCELCSKAFTRKEHFTNHILWHSGETPHRCDFCSKTFTRKEHLLNHVRQHTGESPHRCDYCAKSFTRREHLVNHVRQHTGETPFQCGYCPKAFTRKDHLGNARFAPSRSRARSTSLTTCGSTRESLRTAAPTAANNIQARPRSSALSAPRRSPARNT